MEEEEKEDDEGGRGKEERGRSESKGVKNERGGGQQTLECSSEGRAGVIYAKVHGPISSLHSELTQQLFQCILA